MIRAFILALALTTPALANPDPVRLDFEVLRNGEAFGSHTFSITEQNGVARMSERARFSVDLGPINLFRYEHDCSASWRNSVLQTLSCTTLKDGRRLRFNGAREGEGFVTRGTAGARRFSAATLPSLFIHTDFLRGGAYIDTETGATANLRISRLGAETISVQRRSIRATRYRIQGSLTMDAWYDANGRWVAARFNVGDQRIEYRLR